MAPLETAPEGAARGPHEKLITAFPKTIPSAAPPDVVTALTRAGQRAANGTPRQEVWPPADP